MIVTCTSIYINQCFLLVQLFIPFFVLAEIHPRNYTHGCVRRWRTSASSAVMRSWGISGTRRVVWVTGTGDCLPQKHPNKGKYMKIWVIHRFLSKCFPRFVSEFGTRFGTNGDCYGHMDLSILFFRSCCNRTVVGAASKQICSSRPVRITINFPCPFAHFEAH